MLYLLDANTLIRAHGDYYPLDRIPHYWDWLLEMGQSGVVKIPSEIIEEVTAGRDDVAQWLKTDSVKSVLRLEERVDVATLRRVVADGYCPDPNEAEMQRIGKDPFLIAYGLAAQGRTVVTKENSAPSRKRANRRVPDVCECFSVRWVNDFDFLREANFRINR